MERFYGTLIQRLQRLRHHVSRAKVNLEHVLQDTFLAYNKTLNSITMPTPRSILLKFSFDGHVSHKYEWESNLYVARQCVAAQRHFAYQGRHIGEFNV